MGHGDQIIIALIVRLVFGGITAAIAASKGRNTVGWFFGGFFLACIGTIIVLCLSNLKEEAAKWSAQEVEQRRLREQLRQEQLKNEALRQHSLARLDMHDQKLGIDTRKTAPALNPAPSQTNMGHLSTGNEPGPPENLPEEGWYISESGQQQGPYHWALLHRRASQGTLKPEALVWVEGFQDWKPARDIPTLFPS